MSQSRRPSRTEARRQAVELVFEAHARRISLRRLVGQRLGDQFASAAPAAELVADAAGLADGPELADAAGPVRTPEVAGAAGPVRTPEVADAAGPVRTPEVADAAGPDGGPAGSPNYAARLALGVADHLTEISEWLDSYSKGWPQDRMPAVDRAILYVGAYEVVFEDDVPDPVILKWAADLASKLSTDKSADFVSGLLGRLSKIKPTLL